MTGLAARTLKKKREHLRYLRPILGLIPEKGGQDDRLKNGHAGKKIATF